MAIMVRVEQDESSSCSFSPSQTTQPATSKYCSTSSEFLGHLCRTKRCESESTRESVLKLTLLRTAFGVSCRFYQNLPRLRKHGANSLHFRGLPGARLNSAKSQLALPWSLHLQKGRRGTQPSLPGPLGSRAHIPGAAHEAERGRRTARAGARCLPKSAPLAPQAPAVPAGR